MFLGKSGHLALTNYPLPTISPLNRGFSIYIHVHIYILVKLDYIGIHFTRILFKIKVLSTNIISVIIIMVIYLSYSFIYFFQRYNETLLNL